MSHPDNNPYNAPSPYGQNPYGQNSTPPPVPPAPNSPYENVPQGSNSPYENSPYAQSPYAQSPYANGVPQGVQTEEGKKKSTLAIVFGIIGLFLFPIIFSSLAIYQGKQATALGGNGKPGFILGVVGWVLFVITTLFYLMNR